MRAVELAGAIADPEEMSRAVVPVVGDGVLPGERLLVVQEQRLVRRVEVDLVQLPFGVQVDTARRHEAHGAFDLTSKGFVSEAFGAGGHEVLVPRMDLGEVGVTAFRERAEQVECRGGLVVAAQEPLGVGSASCSLEREVVDDVTTEAGQLDAVARLRIRRAGLRELAGDAPDLHRRHTGPVGEDHRHLQNDLELVPDAVRRKRAERLGAVTGLEHEGFPIRGESQRIGQGASLTGEDERWNLAELIGDGAQLGLGPRGLLRDGTVTPGTRTPGWFRHGLGHVRHLRGTARERGRCCRRGHPRRPGRARRFRARSAAASPRTAAAPWPAG